MSKKKEYNPKGVHIVADLWGCNGNILNDQKKLKSILKSSAILANMHIIGEKSHKFDPQGVTTILLLSESHISIHTYPEVNYAAVDIYACGINSSPEKAIDFIVKSLDTKKINKRVLKRGA